MWVVIVSNSITSGFIENIFPHDDLKIKSKISQKITIIVIQIRAATAWIFAFLAYPSPIELPTDALPTAEIPREQDQFIPLTFHKITFVAKSISLLSPAKTF